MTPHFRLTDKQREANRLLGGPQTHTCLVGGSRSGKTFLLVRAICVRAMRGAGSRHAILRFRFNAVRASIWLDTLPKVMRLCFPGVRLRDSRQDGFAEFPNKSQIWFGGLDEKERVEKILGQEYATILLNEASQTPYSSAVIAWSRLAQKVDGLDLRGYCDLNPTGTGHWTNQLYGRKINPDSRLPVPDPSRYARMFLNPHDNAANLPAEYFAELQAMPERQRKRFLEGLYVAEIDGALWTLETIERGRWAGPVPEMRRVVVAVDPSGTAGKEDKRSDDVGIVVAGLGVDGRYYVLADRTCKLPPAGWAQRAVYAFHEFKADRIVAEVNFGGEMVRATIRSADGSVPITVVTASRGKAVRAEPVSALYESGKVSHVGMYPQLEDEMLNFSTAGYMGSRSPDRADALVWAITDLSGAAQAAEPRIRSF